MKRRDLLLLGLLVAANFLLLWGQSLVAFWKYRDMSASLLPEWRYYVQSLIVLLPALPLVLLRFRHGRKALLVLLAAFVAYAVAMLVKPHVPSARRNQYLAACDWAVDVIRADYAGPRRDAEPFFSQYEYHPLERPAVEAHTKRVSYLLGGRRASPIWCGAVDIPDYIVEEQDRLDREALKLVKYETLAERKFGKRDFIILKRVE